MRAMLILKEKRAFMRCSRQATSEKGVKVVDTSVHTLELHVLLDTESVGGKRPAN